MYYDDVQIRLIILFALSKFKICMSAARLQEVLVWSEILDYFTMMDFIFDLEGLGLLSQTLLDGAVCYDITPKGREMCEMFQNKIPLSVRDAIADAAEEALGRLQMGREIDGEVIPVDHRNFLVRCGIYDRGIPLLELKLYAGTRESANKILRRFQEGSSELYTTILEKIVE